MAREVSKEELKVFFFSVMYDIVLSKIFSNICFAGVTIGSWVCFIGIRAELSPTSRRAWDGHRSSSLGHAQK